MRRPVRKPLLRVAVVLLFLGGLAPSVRGLEVPSARRTWLALQTPHFLIVSDARRGRVHDVALELERMVAAIGRVAPLLARSYLPIEAFLFASDSDFEDYCTAVAGRSCNGLAGLFVPGRHRNYILISPSRFEEARAIACHELTHSFVRNTSPDIPLWLNEGLAEFYGSFTAVGKDIRIGRPDEQHLATLRQKGLLPLATVLAVTDDSPEYNTQGLRPIFYAESWLLTHYLLVETPKGRTRLSEYLARLQRGEDREQAFHAAFGTGTEEFKKELSALK